MGLLQGTWEKRGKKAYCSYNCFPQTLSLCAVSMGCVRNTSHLPLHGSEKCPVGSLSFWRLPKIRFLQELPRSFLDVRLQGSLFRPLLEYYLCEWSFKKKERNQYYITSKNNCVTIFLRGSCGGLLQCPQRPVTGDLSTVMLQPNDCLLCLLDLWPSTPRDPLQKWD